MSEAVELKFEEAHELDESEMKEMIIYLPPSQDDFDSEVARSEKYPHCVPNMALDPCGAETRNTLKDLPRDVPTEMRPTCHSPLYAYSFREFSYRAEKRLLLNEPFLRAPHEVEPSIGSFSNGRVTDGFHLRESKFPSVNLFNISAYSEEDKKLTIESTVNEMIYVKSCLNETVKPNINAALKSSEDKTCLKLKPSADDSIKFESRKVENKIPSENNSGVENLNSVKDSNISVADDFSKLSVNKKDKIFWFTNGLINKRRTFGGLLLFAVTSLGYYNFVWFQ